MSAPTSEAVECPICGESFDPTAAGGWCTNPDCGEWQYLGEEVPEPVSETPDADPADVEQSETETEADAADESAEPSADEPAPDTAESEEDATQDEGDEEEAGVTAAAEGDEADVSTPPDQAAATDSADEDGDETADGDAAAAIDEADATVEEDADVAVDEDADVAVEEPDGSKPEDVEAAAAAATATEACPECGTEVDPGDNFCVNCGADLASAEPTLEECPGCGTAVDADASFCATCGEDLEAARAALAEGAEGATEAAEASAPAAPDTLVLRARGETVSVADDQTVGREIRRIVTETGGGDDEAVRIHREHVRFVREGGEFYLVDLGDNPTSLNDRRLSKGDREPVEPGDEIELSDVVTLTVEAP